MNGTYTLLLLIGFGNLLFYFICADTDVYPGLAVFFQNALIFFR